MAISPSIVMEGCTRRNNYLPSTTAFEQLSRGSISTRAANTSTKGPRPFLSFPFCGGAGPALQHRNGMIRCITAIAIHAALWLRLYIFQDLLVLFSVAALLPRLLISLVSIWAATQWLAHYPLYIVLALSFLETITNHHYLSTTIFYYL